tara:strand:+ start:958 stop:1656 length:699 start_codon:yes stop_codon:yes gene_type:complete
MKKVSNHFIYTAVFLAGLIAVLSVIYVGAQGSTPNPGHDESEIGGIPNCGNNQYLTKTSNGWSCEDDIQGTGGGTPASGCTELTDPASLLTVNPGGGLVEAIITLPAECYSGCVLKFEKYDTNNNLLESNLISYTQNSNSDQNGQQFWQVHGGNNGFNGEDTSLVTPVATQDIVSQILPSGPTGPQYLVASLFDDGLVASPGTQLSEGDTDKIFIRLNTNTAAYGVKLHSCT